MLFGLSKVPSDAGSVSITIQQSSLDGQMQWLLWPGDILYYLRQKINESNN